MLADPEGRQILRARPVINEDTVDLAALAVSNQRDACPVVVARGQGEQRPIIRNRKTSCLAARPTPTMPPDGVRDACGQAIQR